MAILNIYNLYDETIETYVAQYMSTHDNLMKRDCERIYQTSKHAYEQSPMSPQAGLYKYASNYILYKTATFDDQTGIYTSLDVKVPVINFVCFQLGEAADAAENARKNKTEFGYRDTDVFDDDFKLSNSEIINN